MEKELFLHETLKLNIELTRNYDELIQQKADICDGICAVEMAIEEVSNDRYRNMLHTAKNLLTNYHFLLDLMSIGKPDDINKTDN